MAYGVVAAVLTLLGQIHAGSGITALSIVMSVIAGIAAAFVVPAVIYAVAWLTAPSPVLMGELAALREQVSALAKPPAPKPVAVNKPRIAIDWSVFWGVENRVCLAVTNGGPGDAFLAAAVLAVESTSSSCGLPFQLRWEGSTNEEQFVAESSQHNVLLADARFDETEDFVSFVLQGARNRSGFLVSETILPRDRAAVLTIAVYAKGDKVVGRSVGRVKLSFRKRSGQLYAYAEKMEDAKQ